MILVFKRVWNKYNELGNRQYTAFGISGFLILDWFFFMGAVLKACFDQVDKVWLLLGAVFVLYAYLMEKRKNNHYFYPD